MKTYVVRATGQDKSWTGNAESATEAVAYARAKADLYAERYVVYDWDLNCFIVERKAPGT